MWGCRPVGPIRLRQRPLLNFVRCEREVEPIAVRRGSLILAVTEKTRNMKESLSLREVNRESSRDGTRVTLLSLILKGLVALSLSSPNSTPRSMAMI
jgi:hypothetical protein